MSSQYLLPVLCDFYQQKKFWLTLGWKSPNQQGWNMNFVFVLLFTSQSSHAFILLLENEIFPLLCPIPRAQCPPALLSSPSASPSSPVPDWAAWTVDLNRMDSGERWGSALWGARGKILTNSPLKWDQTLGQTFAVRISGLLSMGWAWAIEAEAPDPSLTSQGYCSSAQAASWRSVLDTAII